jgi:hypothetical protein
MSKLLLLGLLVTLFAPAVRAQSFDLSKDRVPIVSLDGLWRFHTGDNPASASPDFDDSQWPMIRSDAGWTQQGYPGLSGYAWYRFKLRVSDGSQPLSLLLAGIFTSYRVYADERLVGAYGYLPPHRLTSQPEPAVYDLPRSSLHAPRTIQIAIRVWQDPVWAYYTPGGSFMPGNLAGDTSLLHQRLRLMILSELHERANLYTYSVLAALFGLLALGLFFLNSADREYLWIALVLLASAADAAVQVGGLLIPVEIFERHVDVRTSRFCDFSAELVRLGSIKCFADLYPHPQLELLLLRNWARTISPGSPSIFNKNRTSSLIDFGAAPSRRRSSWYVRTAEASTSTVSLFPSSLDTCPNAYLAKRGARLRSR